ncbi:MAG: NAD(P)H-binding protein [Myxococcales bacterium]|nr:NAD(P)H-binding protein [Myxococcales bacterium]
MTETTKRILVVGASRGTGAEVVRRLLEEGHEVTAFSRRPAPPTHPRGRTFAGDATDAGDVSRAVAGHDAVVVTLGIAENPLRVRLFGTSGTPLDVRSTGTRHVIAAMRAHGVRRLVVLTSYGVGETRARLRLPERMLFSLLLRPQIDDTEIQQRLVTESDLDWTVAQPVHLTDAEEDPAPFESFEGDTDRMDVSRRSVARFLARACVTPALAGRCVALSAPSVAKAA